MFAQLSLYNIRILAHIVVSLLISYQQGSVQVSLRNVDVNRESMVQTLILIFIIPIRISVILSVVLIWRSSRALLFSLSLPTYISLR